jgi:peptidoglycan-associated lipoprotein
MERTLRILCTLMLSGILIAAVGCGKKQPEVAPAPPPAAEPTPPPAPPPPPPPPPPPAPKPLTEDEIFARKSLEELNAEKPLADVYYDYDSAALSEQARGELEKNAAWLKRWASTRILVEGHCDSRGTNEYNLALGERRADSARDYLVSLGVPTDRVQVVSKGEEQPFCNEEVENCWSQNRRGHFIVTAK